MKNILLLAMSTLGREIKDNYYTYKDGEILVGQSQLEPIMHMVSLERKKRGERLDKIVILETEETLLTHDGRKSAVNFYKERVSKILDADVEFTDVKIDEKNPANGIARATRILLHEYEEQKRKNDKVNLWIDTQGGFRDIVMVFNAIISLLREQGIEPKGIYSIRYSAGNTKENPCPIIDQTSNYDIFRFVSAMQEFMDYGKATGLKKYYGMENRFVQAIDAIADAIQMCQPQKFEDGIRKFAHYLETDIYENEDPYLQIFAEFMRNDYGILLDQPDNTIEQIRWCVKKEFYQQAMTIYIEKMPEYYHKKGILPLKVDLEAKTENGKNPYVKAFYEVMFDEMLKDENDMILDSVLASVVGHEKIGERIWAEYYLSEELARVESEKVKRAIGILIKNIKKRFKRNGDPLPIQIEEKGAKTIRGYLNGMRNNSGMRKRQELLCGTKIPKKDSIEKKMLAIMSAKEKEPEIVKIMEYYLAMKLLRNRMNHASESEISEEEKKVIRFLRSEQIDVGIQAGQNGMRVDYQKIKDLITDGLELF